MSGVYFCGLEIRKRLLYFLNFSSPHWNWLIYGFQKSSLSHFSFLLGKDCFVYLSKRGFLFTAYYATLWHASTSICCNVSTWWHICSPFHSPGISEHYGFIFMFKTSIICMSDGFALYCMLYSNVYNRDHILLAPLQCLLRMESPRPL